MAHPTPAEAAEQAQRRGRGGAAAEEALADVYEPLKGGEDEYEVHEGFEIQEGDLEEHREEDHVGRKSDQHTAAVAARRLRDKRTRFEMDERGTTLTETMTSDATYVPVLEEDNQAPHKTEDLRYQMMERKIERLEKRLEAYEGLQRKLAKSRTTYRDADSGGGGSGETQQLIEFFLTEMDKQNAVIAQMRANERVLEQKLEESMRKTHRFHHEQLQRMAKFQEVVQMMNAEFVQVSMLRDEEKALEKNHQDKKTKAVRRALDEQIMDLKNETSHQRRRLEIKFEKKIVELASENQLLKTENLELRDEVTKLVMAARSNKRTVRVLSDEVIKLKRAVGAPPNPEIEEALRLSGVKPTSKHEVSTVHPA